MDRFERRTGGPDTELERCVSCPSRLVQPVQWRRLDDDLWEIDLRCPDCGARGRQCVPTEAVARYDRVMRRARLTLERHLEAIERIDRGTGTPRAIDVQRPRPFPGDLGFPPAADAA